MTKLIFPLVAGPKPSRLGSQYKYGDTSIAIEDMSYIPSAPNIVTVFDTDNNFITMRYDSILSTNAVSDLTYIEGDQTITFYPSSAYVARTVAKYDFDALNENKLDNTFPVEQAGKYLMVNTDGTLTFGSGGGGGEGAEIIYNATIPTSSWVSSTTYSDYTYEATVPYATITSATVPSVTFSLEDANSGNFAPVAGTTNGYVIIYAKAIPQTQIVIPSIILHR